MLTQEEIEKGSFLIAGYMGCICNEDGTIGDPFTGERIWPQEVGWDTNMNLLVIVVEKIEAEIPEDMHFLIEGRFCWMENPEVVFESTGDSKIEAVFRSVVKYLTWKNEVGQQKKTKKV